jgi:hypothetical protein
MKAAFLATLLLFVAVFSARMASAQQPGPGSNTSHRIVPQPAPAEPTAPAKPAQPSLVWCVFVYNAGTGHATYYVNDVLIHADATSYNAVGEAWVQYMFATYGSSEQRTANCNILGTDTPGGPDRYISRAEQGWKASGKTIIHVNWTYTPASTPAAAPPIPPPPVPAPAAPAPVPPAPPAPVHAAAPAPSAPVGKAYRCTLDFHQATGAFRYSAGPIVSDAAQPALTAAWKSYIDATYHPSDPHRRGGCTILGGNPANRERAVSSYEQNSNQLGVHTTHVNWTSAPSH